MKNVRLQTTFLAAKPATPRYSELASTRVSLVYYYAKNFTIQPLDGVEATQHLPLKRCPWIAHVRNQAHPYARSQQSARNQPGRQREQSLCHCQHPRSASSLAFATLLGILAATTELLCRHSAAMREFARAGVYQHQSSCTNSGEHNDAV